MSSAMADEGVPSSSSVSGAELLVEFNIPIDSGGALIRYDQVRVWKTPEMSELRELATRMSQEWMAPLALKQQDIVRATGVSAPYLCYLLKDPENSNLNKRRRTEVYSVLVELLRQWDEKVLTRDKWLQIQQDRVKSSSRGNEIVPRKVVATRSGTDEQPKKQRKLTTHAHTHSAAGGRSAMLFGKRTRKVTTRFAEMMTEDEGARVKTRRHGGGGGGGDGRHGNNNNNTAGEIMEGLMISCQRSEPKPKPSEDCLVIASASIRTLSAEPPVARTRGRPPTTARNRGNDDSNSSRRHTHKQTQGTPLLRHSPRSLSVPAHAHMLMAEDAAAAAAAADRRADGEAAHKRSCVPPHTLVEFQSCGIDENDALMIHSENSRPSHKTPLITSATERSSFGSENVRRVSLYMKTDTLKHHHHHHHHHSQEGLPPLSAPAYYFHMQNAHCSFAPREFFGNNNNNSSSHFPSQQLSHSQFHHSIFPPHPQSSSFQFGTQTSAPIASMSFEGGLSFEQMPPGVSTHAHALAEREMLSSIPPPREQQSSSWWAPQPQPHRSATLPPGYPSAVASRFGGQVVGAPAQGSARPNFGGGGGLPLAGGQRGGDEVEKGVVRVRDGLPPLSSFITGPRPEVFRGSKSGPATAFEERLAEKLNKLATRRDAEKATVLSHHPPPPPPLGGAVSSHPLLFLLDSTACLVPIGVKVETSSSNRDVVGEVGETGPPPGDYYSAESHKSWSDIRDLKYLRKDGELKNWLDSADESRWSECLWVLWDIREQLSCLNALIEIWRHEYHLSGKEVAEIGKSFLSQFVLMRDVEMTFRRMLAKFVADEGLDAPVLRESAFCQDVEISCELMEERIQIKDVILWDIRATDQELAFFIANFVVDHAIPSSAMVSLFIDVKFTILRYRKYWIQRTLRRLQEKNLLRDAADLQNWKFPNFIPAGREGLLELDQKRKRSQRRTISVRRTGATERHLHHHLEPLPIIGNTSLIMTDGSVVHDEADKEIETEDQDHRQTIIQKSLRDHAGQPPPPAAVSEAEPPETKRPPLEFPLAARRTTVDAILANRGSLTLVQASSNVPVWDGGAMQTEYQQQRVTAAAAFGGAVPPQFPVGGVGVGGHFSSSSREAPQISTLPYQMIGQPPPAYVQNMSSGMPPMYVPVVEYPSQHLHQQSGMTEMTMVSSRGETPSEEQQPRTRYSLRKKTLQHAVSFKVAQSSSDDSKSSSGSEESSLVAWSSSEDEAGEKKADKGGTAAGEPGKQPTTLSGSPKMAEQKSRDKRKRKRHSPSEGSEEHTDYLAGDSDSDDNSNSAGSRRKRSVRRR